MYTTLDYSARVTVRILETSWQAAVLAAIVVLLTLVLRHRLSARWRATLWLLVVVRLLMPVTVQSPVSLFNLLPVEVAYSTAQPEEETPVEEPLAVEEEAPVATPSLDTTNIPATDVAAFPTPGHPTPDLAVPPAPVVSDPADVASEPEVEAGATVPAWSTSQIVWLVVISVWALGTILLALRLLRLMLRLHFLLRQCDRAEKGAVRETFDAARRELGIHRHVELLLAPQMVGPAVTGIFHPRLILGESLLDKLTTDELRLIFLHELSHIRRQDLLAERLWQIAKILHWFNPMVWLVCRRWQADRELACDEAVLAQLDQAHRSSYGHALLRVMESLTTFQPVPGAVGVLMRRGFLADRIRCISRYRPLSRRWTALAVGLLCVLIPIGLTSAVGKSQPESETEEVAATTEEASDEVKDDTEKDDAKKTITITGRCVDEKGKPIAGAHVVLINWPDTLHHHDKVLAKTTTGKDGRYEICLHNVPTDLYKSPQVIVRADHYGITWKHLYFNTDTIDLSFSLAKEEPIRCRLLDEEGKPAAGLSIECSFVRDTTQNNRYSNGMSCPQGEKVKAWLAPLTTDQDGRFLLHNIAPGTGVMLKTEGTDQFAPHELRINFRDTQKNDHPVELDDLPSIYSNIQPDQEGVIKLASAKILEGAIRYEDTGKPVPHASLEISTAKKKSGLTSTMRIETDKDGKYRAIPYPGDWFHLEVHPPKGVPYLGRRLAEFSWKKGTKSKQIDIKLPRGVSVRGKVVESKSQKPISDAIIKYIPARANRRNIPKDILTGNSVYQRSDQNGQFEIAIPAQPGYLVANDSRGECIPKEISSSELAGGKPGGERNYVHAMQQLDPKPDGTQMELTLSMERGETVVGQITDEQGKPVDLAKIITRLQVNPYLNKWNPGWPAYSRNGQFELKGLKKGKVYTVHFLDRKDRLGATATLQSGDQPTIVLQPCGQARATFVDSDGKLMSKFPGTLFIAFAPKRDLYDSNGQKTGTLAAEEDFIDNICSTHYQIHQDTQGRLTFPALIPGATYRINHGNKNGQVGLIEFSVKPGQTLDLGKITNRTISRKTKEEKKQDADSYYRKARTYHERARTGKDPADWVEAEDFYNRCLDVCEKTNRQHVECYRDLAKLLHEQGCTDASFRLLQGWAERNPTLREPKIELDRLRKYSGRTGVKDDPMPPVDPPDLNYGITDDPDYGTIDAARRMLKETPLSIPGNLDWASRPSVKLEIYEPTSRDMLLPVSTILEKVSREKSAGCFFLLTDLNSDNIEEYREALRPYTVRNLMLPAGTTNDKLKQYRDAGLLNNYQLEGLDLLRCTRITDFSPLANLTELKWLYLDHCKDVHPLLKLRKLENFIVMGIDARQLQTLRDKGVLDHLVAFGLWDCYLDDMSALANLPKLRSLSLSYPSEPPGYEMKHKGPIDLSDLVTLKDLRMLHLSGSKNLTDISALGRLDKLEQLRLGRVPNVTDFSSLSKLKNLKTLVLSKIKKDADLSALEDLDQLARLDLCRLDDLSFVAKLKNLQSMIVAEENLKEVSALPVMGHLEKLYFRGTKLTTDDVKSLVEKFPNCEIFCTDGSIGAKTAKIEVEPGTPANESILDNNKPAEDLDESVGAKMPKPVVEPGNTSNECIPENSKPAKNINGSIGVKTPKIEIEPGNLANESILDNNKPGGDVGSKDKTPSLISAQTVTSSVEMSISTIDESGDGWGYVGSTPGTLKMPVCENQCFTLTGLKPENVEAYKKELRRLGIRRIRMPNGVTDSQLKQYREAGLFDDLVSLRLPGSGKNQDLSILAGLKKLQLLELDQYSHLTDVSALTDLEELRTLQLRFCDNLVDLSDLPKLKNLTSLQLFSCRKLTDLSPLAKLKNLKSLNLNFSHHISDISPLAKLKGLRSLSMNNCHGLQDLSAIAKLTGLKKVSWTNCCFLKEADISFLADFHDLTSLVLDASEYKDVSFLFKLHSLKELVILLPENTTDVSFLANLPHLETLRLAGAPKVNDVSVVGKLKNLTIFELGQSSIENLAFLAKSEKLGAIRLDDCPSIKNLSDLSHLKNLRAIVLTGCPNLADISAAANLKDLEVFLLAGSPKVKPEDIDTLKKRLPRCQIQNDPNPPNVPAKAPEKTGEKLPSHWIPAQTITSSLEMAAATMDENGDRRGINIMPGTVVIPACADRYFYLSGLTPENVAEYRKELKRLGIRRISLPGPWGPTEDQLKQYRKAGLFDDLVSLRLDGQQLKKDLSMLAGLKKLRKLDLPFCRNLTDISALGSLEGLKTLKLFHSLELTDISDLSKLKNLTTLQLEGCNKITDISPLAKLMKLKSLNMSHSVQIADLSPLADLENLQSLEIECCKNASNLSAIAKQTGLKKLNCTGCPKLKKEDLSFLANFRGLTSLKLDASECTDLSFLAKLSDLKELTLFLSEDKTDVSFLAHLTKLETLRIIGSPKTEGLSAIGNLKNLTVFELGRVSVEDLAFLAKLEKLEEVRLHDCPSLKNLTGFSGLKKVSLVILSNCRSLADLSAAASCQNLKSLSLYGCPNIKASDVTALRKQLPKCHIDRSPYPRVDTIMYISGKVGKAPTPLSPEYFVSSVKMSVSAHLKDGQWTETCEMSGQGDNVITIPAYDELRLDLTGLTPSNVEEYKKVLQKYKSKVQHVILPKTTTDAELRQYVEAGLLDGVKYLSLKKCNKLKPEDVEKLRTQLPNCVICR